MTINADNQSDAAEHVPQLQVCEVRTERPVMIRRTDDLRVYILSMMAVAITTANTMIQPAAKPPRSSPYALHP